MTEREYPAISVIIPVSRPAKAARTLAALKVQRYAGEVETIVVGVAATALAHDWPVLLVNSGHIREPGRARNLGAAQARGEILLFLDDDAVVAEDWIERNVRALQQPGVGIVGARIAGKSDAFFARCIDFTNYGQYQHGQPFDGPVASTSMGVMRMVFQKVGGFDEILLSGEDIDFCYRVQKQGYRSVYQPDIVVIHDHRRDTFRTLLRYNYTHGIEGGLATKIRHRDAGLKNQLLCLVRAPALFLVLLPLIALLASVRIVAINISENRRVLLYALFIFLGKLAYEFGIFRHLLKRAQSIDRR